jgi:hypothetical protein
LASEASLSSGAPMSSPASLSFTTSLPFISAFCFPLLLPCLLFFLIIQKFLRWQKCVPRLVLTIFYLGSFKFSCHVHSGKKWGNILTLYLVLSVSLSLSLSIYLSISLSSTSLSSPCHIFVFRCYVLPTILF